MIVAFSIIINIIFKIRLCCLMTFFQYVDRFLVVVLIVIEQGKLF